MVATARVLRYVAFGLLMACAVFGGTFIIGDALTDPGGVSGVLMSLAWVVPMAVLVVCAVRWPRPAAGVLTVVAAIVAVFVVVDLVFGISAGIRIGPVGFVSVLAAAVPIGVLGLRSPVRAGWLLLLMGVPLAASLGGAAVVVAVPIVIVGGLFLLAGRQSLGRSSIHTGQ
jgi:predicted anti-sigma-YlaC factor YlaD